MPFHFRNIAILLLTTSVFTLSVGSASAQEGGRRGRGFGRFFLIPKVSLAGVEEVQKELKLSDELNEKIAGLEEEMNDANRRVFEDAQGDWDAIRKGMTKALADVNGKLDELLDDDQKGRLQEVFVQVNGVGALQDPGVAEGLKLTDEQKEKLDQVRNDSREAFMNAGFRNLDEDARAEKMEELTKDREEKTLAVLTDDQRSALEKMKGAELKIDPENLPSFGRRNQGRRDTT